jgi:hypothetical protein
MRGDKNMIGGNPIINNVLQTINTLRGTVAVQGMANIPAEALLQSYILQTITPEMLGVTSVLVNNAFGYFKLPLSPNGLPFSSIPVPPM